MTDSGVPAHRLDSVTADFRAELERLNRADCGSDIGAWAELAGRYKSIATLALAALTEAERRAEVAEAWQKLREAELETLRPDAPEGAAE